ncbi:MAG: radical SAM protein [Deltaproteobacteria bacterium]|jgi:hypothetical protein|nr:radical SAM protein [Deltaproteobacteria bacterium]
MLSVRDLTKGSDLRPQKPAFADTPHATLEVNSECNIRCRHCYNLDRPGTKSVEQIRQELDELLRRRRLDTVSLVGGEPTLHPHIAEVVRAVKKRGLVCQLLTNGVAFLEDEQDRLLRQLVAAGVDRFLVHIDAGQRHVHGDVDAARHAVFERLERHQVYFGLSVTLTRGNEGCLPGLVRQFAQYRYFDGLFVTMAMDMAHAFDPSRSNEHDPSLAAVDRSMVRALGVSPSAYLPSNLDDEAVAWLMYFFYLNVDTGEAFGLSPRYNRMFRRFYRRLKGREFFGETCSPAWFVPGLALSALTELALAPRRLIELLRVLRRSRAGRGLRFHYVVIQEPPRYSAAHGQVELCYQCPDATLRRDRLMPVCIASWLSPADGAAPKVPGPAVRQIYDHLEGAAVA